ncbi:dihydrolipoamide acetyltransferase family protein [Conexibacter woesei]|uniref:Dihydrolipoamide acetyltransferase component of pyruvate dehydrogenase complex n=1 Tax=Conexibacter woesei (strain DSM 14684 / CCUG 47730 / CIP 108061 / JCM 11494 / NBRC 100937 / ID131577) TaxID=469383 RepID=D3FAN0_CONWI|nr:dihydrolipoamide acetyltransferase family protein [Conexibacter woesei]ADB51193.1 catalytic domain of components of various dehydrogenase complexes [Conexibacter woesei DSM 14684]
MPDVVMPRLSDSMEEGTIIKWLKASGEEVARGEELVEIETDKANMTYEADASGTLEIVAEEGATLPIGEPIARLAGGEEPARGAAPAPAAEAPAAPTATAAGGDRNGRVKASPVARRLASELGVDLAGVVGSGPGGRIVKADVEGAAKGGTETAAAPVAEPPAPAAPAPAAPAPAATPGPVVSGDAGSGKGEVTVQELTRTQQVIARRMAESKATIPDYTVTTEVDMEAAVQLREQMKAAATETLRAPSFNDMVVKAAALALREIPKANGGYRDGKWELYSRVNVGIAVATDDALIVPTVFDADKKALGEISRDARALAARVRAGRITPPELSGATFTVSNLGMFGTTEFTAVIVPGQAGILSVGALRDTPVVRGGQIVPGKRMSVTITADHRILNGAEAAQFIARIRELLETPFSLAL